MIFDAKAKRRQVNQYDKVLQENMEAALPGLIKNVLKIDAITSEELPDNLQHTKERKPDVLKKITDSTKKTFILHIEFQTKDEPDMVYRMAEYLIMLLRRYRLPVKQYVIYIGEAKPLMAFKLVAGSLRFDYQLIVLSSIDYKIFLRSRKPEEKLLAILASFGSDSPKTVLTKVAKGIAQSATGELEKEQRKNQLRILAQLRTLVFENIAIMEHITSFFKEENDIFYKVGEKRGIEKGIEKGIVQGMEQGIEKGIEEGIEKGREQAEEKKNMEFVKNLLTQTDFTLVKVASLANVTESFVRKVKKSLK